MKNLVKYFAFFVVCYFALTHLSQRTEGQPVRVIIEEKVNLIKEKVEPRNVNTPCQNLDALDNLKEVMHWEIINDTLHIYTIKDSIRDEMKRWEYIRSLDPEGWE
jgi:hypothetical protein|tara:strand:- start:567 stop:881 length:315 start_codon:yes stop_codon:yes gene_type:complete